MGKLLHQVCRLLFDRLILSCTAKQLLHWRQFAADLGFPQLKPSIMLTDNFTSINLTKAPLIPAKSRHIELKHHHIRWAYKLLQILPQYQGTNDIVPDAATKHVGPTRFFVFLQPTVPPTPLIFISHTYLHITQ
jgi:hypothetical protein